jgi:hypothetical protein
MRSSSTAEIRRGARGQAWLTLAFAAALVGEYGYMKLRHTVDHTVSTLTYLKNELRNTRSGGHQAQERRDT